MTSDDTLVDQRPFYFSHIAVDPRNPNHVYAVSEMLAESKDGGQKFKEIAKDVHVDYHAIWIAPNDPKRIITGEDGGYALTTDLEHWSFSRNLAIGQIYHVGLSNENPYLVCAAFQDNGGFCGPSNSLDSEGILDRHWIDVVGGDGMWTVPDPIDPQLHLGRSRRRRADDLQPHDGREPLRSAVRFVSGKLPRPVRSEHRAVSLQLGFADRVCAVGRTHRLVWRQRRLPIDRSRCDLEHRSAPISRATSRNTRLLRAARWQRTSRAPSTPTRSSTSRARTLSHGEIWVGTDDGYVQMTRDGGAHWHNVTPPGTPEYARIETVAPSPIVAGTAYAIADNHRLGDYAPYAYVTHDYGATWTKIVNGLPAGQYVRTIRPDPRNRNLLYAGTENGMWISYDAGAHWQDFRINLPAVSVRDIHIEPQFDDLVVATHGRDLWILDDVGSVQQLGAAERAGIDVVRSAHGV